MLFVLLLVVVFYYRLLASRSQIWRAAELSMGMSRRRSPSLCHNPGNLGWHALSLRAHVRFSDALLCSFSLVVLYPCGKPGRLAVSLHACIPILVMIARRVVVVVVSRREANRGRLVRGVVVNRNETEQSSPLSPVPC